MTVYKAKYRLQYTPRNDVKTYIDFKLRNYPGTTADVTAGKTPLIFSMESEGDDFNETIKGTSATIELISDSDFKYSSMFNNADAKSWRVDIYKGDKDSEYIKNRDFQGSFDGWHTATNFVIDKDVAKVDSTGSNAILEQDCVFPKADTYFLRIYYAGAQTNETINATYNGVDLGTKTLTSSFGRLTFTMVITSGILNEALVITKSWADSPSTSNLYIKEVSILGAGIGEFGHDYNIFWKGFVQPDLYSEPLQYQPYPVQILATCGLGKLDNLLFEYMAGTGESIHTRNQLEIIQDCLDRTDIYLPVKSTVNLYDAWAMTDGEDPLNELSINQEAFFDYDGDNDTRQEVIRKILKPYFSRIVQSAGFWRIERIPYKKETQTFYWYDIFGNELHNRLTQSDILLLTANDAATPIRYEGRSQSIELDQSWQYVNIEQDKILSDSVVMGEFDEIHWITDYDPRYWNELNGVNSLRQDNTLRINSISASPWLVTHPYLEHTVGSLSGFYNFQWHKLEITFDYRVFVSGGLNETIGIPIIVYYDIGGSRPFINTDGTWITNPPGALEILPFTALVNIESNTDYSDWRSFSLTSDYTHNTGKLVCRIYRAYTGSVNSYTDAYIQIRKFRVKPIGGDILPNPRTTEHSIKENNFKLPDVEEFVFGDLNYDQFLWPIDSRRIYKGLLSSGELLTNADWSEWGNNSRFDLIHDQIRIDYTNQFKYSRHLLKANIYGPLRFESVIQDNDNEGRLFLPIGLQIDDKQSITSGTWIEMYDEGLDKDDPVYQFEGSEFDDTEFFAD